MSFVDEIKRDPIMWRNRALTEPADDLPSFPEHLMSIADAESLERAGADRIQRRDELFFKSGSAALGSIDAGATSLGQTEASRSVGGRSASSQYGHESGTERPSRAKG